MNFSSKRMTAIPANPALKQSLDSLMQASLEVEEGLRAAGRYSKDAKPSAPRHAKGGFAVLLENDGSASLIPLGDIESVKPRQFTPDEFESFREWFNPGPDEQHHDKTKRMVEETEEPYEMMGEKNFERAKEESHFIGKRNPSSPVHTEGRTKNPVGDAVIEMREAQDIARSKQKAISDSMKRESRRQFTRNVNIAAAMKAESDRLWKK